MEFRLTFNIPPLLPPIRYEEKLLSVGSCFAENIGAYLAKYKFQILQNPHGILYNPLSIVHALHTYLDGKLYREEELFFYNDIWQSWDHHGRFAHMDRKTCLEMINTSQLAAIKRIKEADWLLITLGSSFVYNLKENGRLVGNCHKVPQQQFDKRLLTVEEVISSLDNCIHQLFTQNRKVKIIFSVSPVRYTRYGVVENKLSKAILILAVHQLVNKFDRLYYFPAYELVIDDLRDYRFYKADLLHPNEMAIQYVWEKFVAAAIDEPSRHILEDIESILQARAHRAMNPSSEKHRQFLRVYAQKTKFLQDACPFLDLQEELAYFQS